ncbi:hypothetical protein [Pseudomonas quasicaspiana]|uniref:hypothetical protein n=1 Tax=Pseudomonas quasicaspiana TaxID=2829821 RepID=UPI001E4364B2|nr:hypothetical protein [Pseudomonas quasicaspiana]MCD5974328.1 hypothetical protein [Pseudomonas quasicaspiana]
MKIYFPPLPAPTIPVAQADGLIKTSDLTNDVSVFFPIWPDEILYSSARLVINDLPVGDFVQITDPRPDQDTQFELLLHTSDQLQIDGSYTISYQATSHENGVTEQSQGIVIRVDRTAPGGAMLASVAFAGISFGDVLNGRIAGYAGMEPGDVIQTVCNGIQGPTYHIQPKNLTTSPVEISFTQEFLEGLFSDRVNITYHVTDRAGNRSILAQSVEITMQR